MDIWLITAVVLTLSFIPCGIVIVRERVLDRIVALQMAGILSVFIIMLLAESFRQPSFMDLALTLAILSLPAGLVFAFFFERWL